MSSKRFTGVSQDEIEQGSLDPSKSLDIMDDEEDSIQASQEEKKASSQKKGKAQKVIVVKGQGQVKKTTKDQTPQPRVKVQATPVAKAANTALPEAAPNGSKIKYFSTSLQDEVVEKLKDLSEGGQLYFHRWKEVNGKFGPTHILYTYPDEDGHERAFWGNYRSDRYVRLLNMETQGLLIAKIDDELFYGSFDK